MAEYLTLVILKFSIANYDALHDNEFSTDILFRKIALEITPLAFHFSEDIYNNNLIPVVLL